MSERRLRESLRGAPLPDAEGARERGLRVVRAAHAGSPGAQIRRGRVSRRGLYALVAAALLLALISPAGAAVRDWVGSAVDGGSATRPRPLTSLPAEGSLLVQSPRGPWVVRRDGSKRLLGDYGTASWSPHGLYVAAADDRQLLALEPDGDVRWSLARPVPRHTAWSPDGFRIAYLSRGDLRLVGADGAGDHLLARGVAPLAPAWRPGSPRRLAYATAAGRVRVLDLKSGSSRLLFGAGAPARALAWSAQGSRLLVATRARIFVLDPRGGIVRDWPVPEGERVAAAALSPDGARTAVVLRGAPGRRSRLLLLDRRRPPRDLFAGPGVFDGVSFSPDGRWLLLAWRTADEWVFLEPRHPRRVLAVSGIAEQFDPGTTSRPAFPSVAGWCCPLAPGG